MYCFELGTGLKPKSRLAAPLFAKDQSRGRIGRAAEKLVPRRVVNRRHAETFEYCVRLSILFAERVAGDAMVPQELFQLHSRQCLSSGLMRPETMATGLDPDVVDHERELTAALFVLPNSDIGGNLRRLTVPARGPYDAIKSVGPASCVPPWEHSRYVASSASSERLAVFRHAHAGGVWTAVRRTGGRYQADRSRIAAASDLQLALPKLIERFQVRTGIEATPIFGASGRLSEQIRQGAPFDVFLAANEKFVRDLASEGVDRARLGADLRERDARAGGLSRCGRTCSHPVRPDQARSQEDRPRPAADRAYGLAGKQAIERSGLWDTLEPKIVFADSVRQALLYAQRGDVEAAFVGRAIANVPEIRVIELDPRLYDPIIQALGIVSATRRPADAGRFARFVLDEEGQGVLKEFGFDLWRKSGRSSRPDRSAKPRNRPHPRRDGLT